MSVTTFSATVEDGQIKLSPHVRLPENTRVYVVVTDFDEQANSPKFDLAELISRMPADYQPTEDGFGEPVGKEECRWLHMFPRKATSSLFLWILKPVTSKRPATGTDH